MDRKQFLIRRLRTNGVLTAPLQKATELKTFEDEEIKRLYKNYKSNKNQMERFIKTIMGGKRPHLQSRYIKNFCFKPKWACL